MAPKSPAQAGAGRSADAPPAADGWEFAEGDEIVPGRFAVRLLGGGERFETYLAWDDARLSLVVIKILRPGLVEDEHSLRRLTAEADLVARLAHPVIVRGFESSAGARPHLVLEYLDGPRLSSLVRRHGPLEAEQLLPLALQLCSALHYLAREDVVHLDVKPSNVIMGAPARLIDLSIARTVAQLEGVTHPIGTDAYMAPEQCDPKQRGPITSAADVWGMGATLYHGAAGRPPYADRAGERFPQLRGAPAPLPGDVPRPTAAMIEGCLDPEPGARPSPEELAAEVESLVAAIPRKPVLARFRIRPR